MKSFHVLALPLALMAQTAMAADYQGTMKSYLDVSIRT